LISIQYQQQGMLTNISIAIKYLHFSSQHLLSCPTYNCELCTINHHRSNFIESENSFSIQGAKNQIKDFNGTAKFKTIRTKRDTTIGNYILPSSLLSISILSLSLIKSSTVDNRSKKTHSFYE
jgi:hypothetical protein